MTAEIPDLPPFSSLVENHGDELLAYSRRLADDAAEDVLQEALLKALKAYPGLENGKHLRAWLFRVTTTSAIDYFNRTSGRSEVALGSSDGVHAAPTDDMFAFDGLIAGLSEGARAALVLRYIRDMPYEEMAATMDCSPEAARQRVSSAVRSLRKRLT
jgi:RNA polymerase sigma-70 factor (ECF subfamily)